MLKITSLVITTEPLSWPEFKVSIGAHCIIEGTFERPVSIGRGTKIGHLVSVSEGVHLGEDVRLDSQSLIGTGTTIGDGSEIHGVKVFRDVVIGKNSFIGGEVSNWTRIGDEVTFMGRIVHTYRKPGTADSWRNSPPQPSPNIKDNCVIGENALLFGGIEIGEGSYVAAGEIVKTHLPPGSIFLKNRIRPLSDFRGFIQSRR